MDADRIYAVAGSVVVHLVLVGILAFTLWERPRPPAVALETPIIQARAMDEATAMEPVRRREAEEQRRKQEAEQKKAEAEKQRKLEAEQKKVEAEKQRKLEAEQKKVEAEKQRKFEAEKKKVEAEKQQKAEAEKQRLAEEQRKKAEAEKQRLAEEQRKKAEAEEKLKQELAAEEARLRVEEQRLSAQRRAGMVNQYLAAITSKVTGNWLRQPGMSEDFSCKVWVKQIPSGEVVDVRIIESSGNPLLDRSVEAAVWKSSPLPPPPSPEIFDREVVITFVPR